MIIISKPNESDVVGIQEVFYKTWLQTYPNSEAGITIEDIEEHFKNRLTPETIEKRKLRILNIPENELFLVAKDEDKVVGLCRLIKHELNNELQAIYVLPEYQRMKIGYMFWEKALDFFDLKKEVIVHVATYNEKAINFYKKIGFVDTGKRFTDEKYKMPVSGSLIPEMEMIFKK